MDLRYFEPNEFREWWEDMSPYLLLNLDEFRHLWGQPVIISTHPDALGRRLGKDNKSQHNYDKWGIVKAVDCFPVGMNDTESRRRAFNIASDVGFTGIGLYTDTHPQNMLHLDMRSGRNGQPATWSRVDGEYKSILEVV